MLSEILLISQHGVSCSLLCEGVIYLVVVVVFGCLRWRRVGLKMAVARYFRISTF